MLHVDAIEGMLVEVITVKVDRRGSTPIHLQQLSEGCKASTLRPSCLALCYSAAEYACPVWARSAHAPKLCLGRDELTIKDTVDQREDPF